MTTVRLKHVERFRDRHGKLRHYFRIGKGPRTPLIGKPGTEEFLSSYQAALLGQPQFAPAVVLAGGPGTFDRLVSQYFNSSDFLRNAPSTQRAYRLVIERWLRDEGIGHRRVCEMRREHVNKMMAKRAKTPGAANDLLKKIRILMAFAISNGYRADDPTLKMKKFKAGEWHTWTNDEIAKFESYWLIGSRERLAFALLLYTGQRVSDVSMMTDADIGGSGAISVTQLKTKTKLTIPMHPDLALILSATEGPDGALVSTTAGESFSRKGLANFMADAIGKAGLPDRCVTHGLRKAAARRLAEAGCTAHQIMAITGHKTLAEVERYTKASEQLSLAVAAIDRLPARLEQPKSPNPNNGLGKTEEKTNETSVHLGEWRAGQDETANSYIIEISL